ncbi:MAG: cyclic nucleotide-binding domain-containing protein [Alcanivoracaceae bacterium]|nr:cyclic nucleotide-binding domain-containing protein [Alcanivoracaceae bacterium]
MQVNEEYLQLLRKMPVFAQLSKSQIEVLLGHMEEVIFPAGSALFEEGDHGDRLYYIIAGFLEVVKAAGTSQARTLASMGPGESLGEMAIIDELPRSATVAARSEVHALVLTREAFDQVVHDEPAIGVEILKGLARRMSMNLRYTDFLTVNE